MTPKVEKKEWTIYFDSQAQTVKIRPRLLNGQYTHKHPLDEIVNVTSDNYVQALETALKSAVKFIDKSDIDGERYYESYQEYQDALAKVDVK